MNPPDIEYNLKLSKSSNPIKQECGTNYLICKFQPMLHKLSYEICPTCNIQDMIGAGNLGIMMAISTYNGKCQFSSWVFSKVRNEMQKQREIEFPVKISRYLLKKGNKASYTNKSKEGSYTDIPYQNLIDEENLDKLTEALRQINGMFPKLHVKIFQKYYFEDKQLKDLSKQYHTNAKYLVNQIIERLRKNAK